MEFSLDIREIPAILPYTSERDINGGNYSIMDATFIEEMKERLYKERKEILDRMNGENSSFKEEGATGRGDSVDLASDEGAFKKMEALNAMDAKRLVAVENALKRISENKYGICLKCGKRIPEDRLRAMPSAVLCIDCKSAEEKRRNA